MSDYIKSSTHSLKESNKHKLDDLNLVLCEYRRVASCLIEYIWSNGYTWTDANGVDHIFDIKNNKLDCPSMFLSDIITKAGIDSWLSGRALKCCMTQVAGMLQAATEKQRKRLYVLSTTPHKKRKSLVKRVKQNIPQKPTSSNMSMELNSICCDYQPNINIKSIDGFLRLKSISKNKLVIHIPIKMHRHSKKLEKSGSMLNSYLFKGSSVDLRWRCNKPELKTQGEVVGADQGLKTVVTFSDKQTTPSKDNHNHTLESIVDRMCRRKKGSRGFARAQAHRENFINWSINRLDLSAIKQINMEDIKNIGYKNKTSRKLSHWTNTLIRDKVTDLAMQHGVHVVWQGSTYRSQRCSDCGLVRKANRKSKAYICQGCGLIIDADLNASINHATEGLAEIPYTLRNLNLNRNGFYWKPEGVFDLEGRSLQSLPLVEVA